MLNLKALPFFLIICPCLFSQTEIGSNGWKMRLGDDPSWALPNLDDRQWQTLAEIEARPEGPTWYRTPVTIDPNLHRPGLLLAVKAEIEVYWNGKILEPVCPGGVFPINYIYTLDDEDLDSAGVLAFRYLGPYSGDPMFRNMGFTFQIFQGELKDMVLQRLTTERAYQFHKAFLVGICLAFSLLHILLFLFYPELRANLYYAGLTFSSGFLIWGFLSLFIEPDFATWLRYQQLSTLSVSVPLLFGLRFTYALTFEKCPRYFLPLTLPFIILSVWGWFQPFLVFEFNGSLIVIAFAEITRILIISRIKKRKPLIKGVPIIAIGGIPAMLAILYEIALLNFSMKPFLAFLGVPIFFYAMAPLMISVSVFLARHFATTNRDLARRLDQVRELSAKTLAQELERARLEAENERKNRELEEARNLQLSMLPKKAPEAEGYAIAFYMQTATEVGGDYYDFHFCAEKGLTLVIGDATGHGTRAGAMVAAGKGVFHAYAGTPPNALLSSMGGALKKMKLKNMFMAMAAVKIEGDQLKLANAGMPGALHYSKEDHTSQEIRSQGPPLGSVPDFPYNQAQILLKQGDLVVLLSDGLPERFNPKDQLFGMARIHQVLKQEAHRHPEALIQSLLDAGEQWSDGRPPDDDMTFVVIKKV